MRGCPLIATDIIIEYWDNDGIDSEGIRPEEKIPLIERLYEPYGLAIPGGHQELGLTVAENAVKEGNEETSLDVVIYTPEIPLCVKSDPYRDPRYPIISIVFVGRGTGVPNAQSDAKRVHLYTKEDLRHLVRERRDIFAFPDHAKILETYLEWKEAQK